MRFRLKFAARCFSISAISISTLLGSSADAMQSSNGYGLAQFGAYGSVPAGASNQNYATSRPFQADPAGSGYQSMSPDSWGNPAARGADPFASPRPASPFNNSATAGIGQTQPFRPNPINAPGSFAYGQTPVRQPGFPVRQPDLQNQLPAYAGQPASGTQYESTGAPSVQRLLGSQGTQQPPALDRAALPSPFRPADFDLRDPKDISLAPTIPASILDRNNNRLDSPSSDGESNVATGDVSTSAPQTSVELEPPGQQLPVEKRVIPDLLSDKDNDSVLGKVELPNNLLPEKDSQPTAPSATPSDPPPAVSYPTTPAQPFSDPAPAVSYPTTPAKPFSDPAAATPYPTTSAQSFAAPSPVVTYPQTTGQPFVPPTQVQQVQVPGTQVPFAPYQLPQVFEAVPANTAVSAPANVVPADGGSGFGWGAAPGIFGRNAQASPALQPQPVLQAQPDSKPSFPLPFGLGSKLFGKRGGKKNLQLDFSQPTVSQPGFSQPGFSQPDGSQAKRSLFGAPKQVDPNTYPPQPAPHSQPTAFQTGALPPQVPNAQFRPDLGQRAPLPTVRNPGTYDSGKAEYDFENKKREFPPFSEILATGRYFASIEGQFVKPRFNGNSGIAILDQSGGVNATDSQVFDFDYEFIPSLRVGFESQYGPGFEVDFRRLRTASVVQSFTSGAATSASLRSTLPDLSLSSVISTTAPGQTLSGAHTLNFESIGFSVFKEVQLPVTRINGMFGFQAVDLDHQVDATVVDGTGAVLQGLNSRSDLRAFGPRIRIEYFRPVGHTRLEFLTQVGGSLLFGKRDQFIGGQGVDSFQRIGTDELVTTFEFLTALQIKQRIGEKRSVFGRIGYLNQAFNSGGSGFLAQDDFGLRGVTFLVGYNR